MEVIQSSHNTVFKQLRKLAESRRERQKTGLALLDGTHLLAAWLDAGRPVERLVMTEPALLKTEVASLLVRAKAAHSLLDERLFADISELPSYSGMIAVVAIPEATPPREDGFCLLLDGIQDPGNVGAILRTAVAAGVQQAILSPACADVWSPKTLRAGMGAQAVLDMVESADLLKFSSRFKGKIAATMLDGATDVYQTDLRGDLALVLGSEGGGISPEMAAHANVKIKIPMKPGIESLNVGAAAAICMFERVRQESICYDL